MDRACFSTKQTSFPLQEPLGSAAQRASTAEQELAGGQPSVHTVAVPAMFRRFIFDAHGPPSGPGSGSARPSLCSGRRGETSPPAMLRPKFAALIPKGFATAGIG